MSDPACALPTPAPEAEAALAGVRTIAVVGLSPQPERPSHQVASYLQSGRGRRTSALCAGQ